jgi:hypothetical protein
VLYRNPEITPSLEERHRTEHATKNIWSAFNSTVYIFVIVTIITFLLVWLMYVEPQVVDVKAIPNNGDYLLGHDLVNVDVLMKANVRIIMIVVSSWTESAYAKRKAFRETTLRLAPQNSDNVALVYRFVLGATPGKREYEHMRVKIQEEHDQYGDILVAPTSDAYENLSEKVYKAFVWTTMYNYDYLIKTDEDIFVRLDTVSKELVQDHPLHWYWRGLAYWDIPPLKDSWNKNSDFSYELPVFPAYTAGAMYILSRDIVARIVSDGPRVYTKNEDQNLGVWLFPYNIRPIHDRRIQQIQVCEDDMIAKHFSSGFELKDKTRYDMYDNVINGRPMCQGFRQDFCAFCYPCEGRTNHWKDWNYDCDSTRGVTLLKQDGFHTLKSDLEQSAIDPPTPLNAITRGDSTDAWITEGLLSRSNCTLSETSDWHLVFWTVWTTDASTFKDRHYRALELIYAHQPRAVVFMLSPTLPLDFFKAYTDSGYQIHVLRLTAETIQTNKWFVGPNSEWWAERLQEWSKSQYYFWHLADYIRYVMLYKYGGTYMDMDALWLRMPPDNSVEFIGMDKSSVPSDAVWTLDLDGTYLAIGVLRFKRGWRFIRQMLEDSFNQQFDPNCFNCQGTKAITVAVKNKRDYLILHGLQLLPREILYPYDYLHAENLLKKDTSAQRDLELLSESSWNIHLYGKMTNKKTIEKDSLVDIMFERFGIFIPEHKVDQVVIKAPQHINQTEMKQDACSSLVALNRVLVRGGPVGAHDMNLRATVHNGTLGIGSGSLVPRLQEGVWKLPQATIGDVNRILSELCYHPPSDMSSDQLAVDLQFGSLHATTTIQIIK